VREGKIVRGREKASKGEVEIEGELSRGRVKLREIERGRANE